MQVQDILLIYGAMVVQPNLSLFQLQELYRNSYREMVVQVLLLRVTTTVGANLSPVITPSGS
ncbi:MAG: hypothetical protein IPI23_21245 [Bacteroidetes bacterium]|nr:hypothetical protein [Bacteroidota bacterium]